MFVACVRVGAAVLEESVVRIGSVELPVPVVLAPMAGSPMPRSADSAAEQGAGLYVCEMITAAGCRAPAQDSRCWRSTLSSRPARCSSTASIPASSVRRSNPRRRVASHHIDFNFGCPVPKVTRKGGGAALPWKRDLLARDPRRGGPGGGPGDVPVTMKTRMGIDREHLTYLDAGRIAEEVGCAAIALHGRTADQHYSGDADWDAIAAQAARPVSRCSATATSGRPRCVAHDGRDRMRRRGRGPGLSGPSLALSRSGRCVPRPPPPPPPW